MERLAYPVDQPAFPLPAGYHRASPQTTLAALAVDAEFTGVGGDIREVLERGLLPLDEIIVGRLQRLQRRQRLRREGQRLGMQPRGRQRAHEQDHSQQDRVRGGFHVR